MNKAAKVALAAVAGFAAGVLLAPKSGKETRADIKQKAGEAKDYTTKQAKVVKDKAEAGYCATKDGFSEAKGEASSFFNRAGKHSGEVAKDAKKTAGTVASSARDTGKNVRDAVK